MEERDRSLEAAAADGTARVQEMVEKATALAPGEQATARYVDPEVGPTTVRLAYPAPWDRGIATAAPDRDVAGPVEFLTEGPTSMFAFRSDEAAGSAGARRHHRPRLCAYPPHPGPDRWIRAQSRLSAGRTP